MIRSRRRREERRCGSVRGRNRFSISVSNLVKLILSSDIDASAGSCRCSTIRTTRSIKSDSNLFHLEPSRESRRNRSTFEARRLERSATLRRTRTRPLRRSYPTFLILEFTQHDHPDLGFSRQRTNRSRTILPSSGERLQRDFPSHTRIKGSISWEWIPGSVHFIDLDDPDYKLARFQLWCRSGQDDFRYECRSHREEETVVGGRRGRSVWISVRGDRRRRRRCDRRCSRESDTQESGSDDGEEDAQG